MPGLARAPFDPSTDQIQRAFEVVGLAAAKIAEEDLFDFRPDKAGAKPKARGIDRRLTPAVDVETVLDDLGFDDRSAGVLCGEIGARQKDHPRAEIGRERRSAHPLDIRAEERLRDGDKEAGAVAGLAVRRNGAPMPDGFEGRDRHVDDVAPGLAVDRRDEADAAGVMLRDRIIGACVDEDAAAAEIGVDRVRHGGRLTRPRPA